MCSQKVHQRAPKFFFKYWEVIRSSSSIGREISPSPYCWLCISLHTGRLLRSICNPLTGQACWNNKHSHEALPLPFSPSTWGIAREKTADLRHCLMVHGLPTQPFTCVNMPGHKCCISADVTERNLSTALCLVSTIPPGPSQKKVVLPA